MAEDLGFLPDQPKQKTDISFLPDQPKGKEDLSFLPDKPAGLSSEKGGTTEEDFYTRIFQETGQIPHPGLKGLGKRGELWEQYHPTFTLESLIPFSRQIQGLQEWRSPETGMEAAQLYAIPKVFKNVVTPAARALLGKLFPQYAKALEVARIIREAPEARPVYRGGPSPRTPLEPIEIVRPGTLSFPPEPKAPLIESTPLKPQELRYAGEINELREMVRTAEAGKRIPVEGQSTNEWMGYGSTMPPGLSGKGWAKADILRSIDKALSGEELTPGQQEIFDTVKSTARGMFAEKVKLAQAEKIQPIPTGELELGDKIRVHGETLKVTEKTPEEIVIKDGQEYKLDPYFDQITGKKIELTPYQRYLEVEKLYSKAIQENDTETINRLRPELAELAKQSRRPELTPPSRGEIEAARQAPAPSLSPTASDQYLLPGVKQGVTFPTEGKAVSPTLEGTPLAEAAARAELEKIQPSLSLESIEPAIKGGVTGPLPKTAGTKGTSINLERIEGPQDLKHFINEIGSTLEGQVGREKISWEETVQRAENLGLTRDEAVRLAQARSLTAPEMAAIEQLHRNIAEDTFNTIRNLPVGPERTDKLLAEVAEKLNNYAEILKWTSRAKTEAGRVLNIQKRMKAYNPEFGKQAVMDRLVKDVIEQNGGKEHLTDVIDKLKILDPNNPTQINQFLKNINEPGLKDKVYEVWINALLSNLLTHIVNSTSNTLTFLGKYPEKVLTGGIDWIRALATGKPQERFAGEAVKDAFSLVQGLKDGIRAGVKSFESGLSSQQMVSKVESREALKIPGLAGKLRPTRMLTAEDEFFKGILYRTELNGLAFRQATQEGLKGEALVRRIAELIQNPSEEMTKKATEEMLYRTYQKPMGAFGNLMIKLRDVEIPFTGIQPLRYFIPFIRTPANIAKFALERTPANVPMIILKAAKGNLKGGQLSEEMAKTAIGSLTGMGLYVLAKEGSVTGGGPKERLKRDELLRTGWQPYSVKIGDKYYSYARLEPLGSILGMSADLAEMGDQLSENEKLSLAGRLALSISKNVTSKTFMRGISDLLDATSNPEQYGERWIESITGTVIPSVVAGVSRATDKYFRQPEGVVENIKSRIPGVAQTVTPKINVWGQPIERPGSAVSRFISPVQISAERGSPIDKELTRLKLDIGYPSKRIGKLELDPQDYQRMVEMAGQRAKERLNQLIGNPAYRLMSDEGKQRQIRYIVNQERDQARSKMTFELLGKGRKEVLQK